MCIRDRSCSDETCPSANFSPAYASAIFYGQDIDHTWEIVKSLDSKGFRVVHQLDSLKKLDELAIGLSLLAILLISGTVLSAAFNTLAISWLDVTARKREFGIKKAYGLSRLDLLLAGATESLILVLIACLFGSFVSLTIEPSLSKILVSQFGLPKDFFFFELSSGNSIWLFEIAALVMVTIGSILTMAPMMNTVGKPTTNLFD